MNSLQWVTASAYTNKMATNQNCAISFAVNSRDVNVAYL